MEPTSEQIITAWYYELAQAKLPDGTYIQWAKCLSFTKPFVPAEAIRNIKLLVSIPDITITEEPADAASTNP